MSKIIYMIYNLYGENSFLLNSDLKTQLNALSDKGFETIAYDFDFLKDACSGDRHEEILFKLKNSIDSIDLFNNKKAIIAKNFSDKMFLKAPLKQLFLSLEKVANDHDIFVFFISKSKIVFPKSISPKTKEYKTITNKQIDEALKEISLTNHVSLTTDAIELLKDVFENNLVAIQLEIEKLSNYKNKINSQDILDLINKPSASVKFAISNALSTLNQSHCLKTLLQELDAHTFDLLLFGSVVSYIRNAILIKEKNTLKKPGVKIHPFVEKTMSKFVNKFTLKELKNLYAQLYQDDLLIKKGKLSARLSLEMFISKNI